MSCLRPPSFLLENPLLLRNAMACALAREVQGGTRLADGRNVAFLISSRQSASGGFGTCQSPDQRGN